MAQLVTTDLNRISLRSPNAITPPTMLHFRTLRAGGGAEIDFNLYLLHPSGKVELVY
jgi:hypothetical protein